MTHRELQQPRIRLNARAGEEPMTMDMQQFFEFSFWIAEELLDLEAQYKHWKTDAPCRSSVSSSKSLDA